MFPFVNTTPEIQFYLREKMLERIRENNLFKEIKATNSLEDILDESVIQRNGWMMYGSHKPGSLSYELTGIYYINTDEIIEPRPLSMYDNNQRVKLFCIRGRKDAQRPLLDGKLEMIQQYLAQKGAGGRSSGGGGGGGGRTGGGTGSGKVGEKKRRERRKKNVNHIKEEDVELN